MAADIGDEVSIVQGAWAGRLGVVIKERFDAGRDGLRQVLVRVGDENLWVDEAHTTEE